jgi:hypothetical protein
MTWIQANCRHDERGRVGCPRWLEPSHGRRHGQLPTQAGAHGCRQPGCQQQQQLAGRLLGGRADPPLLRADRARRRGHDRQPGWRQGRVRRAVRPARPVEMVVGRPHQHGLHPHPGADGPARRHAQAHGPEPGRLRRAADLRRAVADVHLPKQRRPAGHRPHVLRGREGHRGVLSRRGRAGQRQAVGRLASRRREDAHRVLQRRGGLREQGRGRGDHAVAAGGRPARTRRQLRHGRAVHGIRGARRAAGHRTAAVLRARRRPHRHHDAGV